MVRAKRGNEPMKSYKYVNVFVALNALIFCLSGTAAQAGQGNKGANHRGGQADSHMSEKGATNSNAQWSADPVRGWVRAEERDKLQAEKQNLNKGKKKSSKVREKGNKTVKP